jgi:hypothetical protein
MSPDPGEGTAGRMRKRMTTAAPHHHLWSAFAGYAAKPMVACSNSSRRTSSVHAPGHLYQKQRASVISFKHSQILCRFPRMPCFPRGFSFVRCQLKLWLMRVDQGFRLHSSSVSSTFQLWPADLERDSGPSIRYRATCCFRYSKQNVSRYPIAFRNLWKFSDDLLRCSSSLNGGRATRN